MADGRWRETVCELLTMTTKTYKNWSPIRCEPRHEQRWEVGWAFSPCVKYERAAEREAYWTEASFQELTVWTITFIHELKENWAGLGENRTVGELYLRSSISSHKSQTISRSRSLMDIGKAINATWSYSFSKWGKSGKHLTKKFAFWDSNSLQCIPGVRSNTNESFDILRKDKSTECSSERRERFTFSKTMPSGLRCLMSEYQVNRLES